MTPRAPSIRLIWPARVALRMTEVPSARSARRRSPWAAPSAVVAAGDKGGVFASESLDYYSYSSLTYDQLSALPHAAMSILRRYARG
mgnify:CR=1 FL=1